MSSMVITTVCPPPSDGIGLVAESSAIPIMRGRARVSDRALVRQLDDALASLSETTCGFWACRGATRPAPMQTCSKCQAMRVIASVRASLAKRVIASALDPGS